MLESKQSEYKIDLSEHGSDLQLGIPGRIAAPSTEQHNYIGSR
jgi:hypothetical protein